MPLGEQVKLFAKIGGAYSFANTEENGAPGIFSGAGIGYAFNQHIETTVQYVGLTIPFFSTHIIAGGITYHF